MPIPSHGGSPPPPQERGGGSERVRDSLGVTKRGSDVDLTDPRGRAPDPCQISEQLPVTGHLSQKPAPAYPYKGARLGPSRAPPLPQALFSLPPCSTCLVRVFRAVCSHSACPSAEGSCLPPQWCKGMRGTKTVSGPDSSVLCAPDSRARLENPRHLEQSRPSRGSHQLADEAASERAPSSPYHHYC